MSNDSTAVTDAGSENKTPRVLYGTRVDAAFALELGRLRGEDYTDPGQDRPKYITRPELIRIGIENGTNFYVDYINDHPGSREAYMTDEMLEPDQSKRTKYTRFGITLGVPGKATQRTASRNPAGPRASDGTPQYKMDIFFTALDNLIRDMKPEEFNETFARTTL